MAPNKLVKGAEPFVCGGSAATFASCVIHPMDLAKVRSKEQILVHLRIFSHFNLNSCFLSQPITI